MENPSNKYLKKGNEFSKQLEGINRDLQRRVGLQPLDEPGSKRIKQQLKLLNSRVNATRQTFKNEVRQLVTKNIENNQNVLVPSGLFGKKNVIVPRISEMDAKIKSLKNKKKSKNKSIFSKINELEEFPITPVTNPRNTSEIQEKKRNKAEKATSGEFPYLFRRNQIYEEIKSLLEFAPKNRELNKREKERLETRIKNAKKDIEKLKSDFFKEIQGLYRLSKEKEKVTGEDKFVSIKDKPVSGWIRPAKPNNKNTYGNKKDKLPNKIVIEWSKLKEGATGHINTWDKLIRDLTNAIGEPLTTSELLKKSNWEILDVPGDGNCQFRAVATSLINTFPMVAFGGVERLTDELRAYSVEYLRRRFAIPTNAIHKIYYDLYGANNAAAAAATRAAPVNRSKKRKATASTSAFTGGTARRTAQRTSVPKKNGIPNYTGESLARRNAYLARMAVNEWGDALTLLGIANYLNQPQFNASLVILQQTPEAAEYFSGPTIFKNGNNNKKNKIYILYNPYEKSKTTTGKDTGHYESLRIRNSNAERKINSNLSNMASKL